nr:hypothetical protein CFP56_00568 [Quercus suber]
MTSLLRNLLLKQSQSSRSNLALARSLRYFSVGGKQSPQSALYSRVGHVIIWGWGGRGERERDQSRLTIFVHVTLDLGQGVTDGGVGVEKVVVFARVPLLEAGQLGGDGLEEADDDADGRRLHVLAELVDGLLVRDAVVAVELHLLPDGEQDGGEHEDGGPVLELVARVDRAVQRRQLLEDVLLQLAPHVGQRALDLEVDHHRRHDLAVPPRRGVVDDARALLLLRQALDHGHVQRQVVGDDELERLADRERARLLVVAVGRLEDLADELGAVEVLVDERLEALVEVQVEVVGQVAGVDALHAGRQLGRVQLVLGVGRRLDEVDAEALVVAHVHLAGRDGQVVAVAVGDVDRPFHVAEALDVADAEPERDVSLVVGLPVLHEVADVLDVHARARHLPQARVTRATAAARLTLVAGLLQELAAETGPQLADLVGLLPLVGPQGTPAPPDLLLDRHILPTGIRRGLLDDGLGGLALERRFPATQRRRRGTGRGRRGRRGAGGAVRDGDGGGGGGARGAERQRRRGRRLLRRDRQAVRVLVLDILGVEIVTAVKVMGRTERPGRDLLVAARQLGRTGPVRGGGIRVGADVQVLAGVGDGAGEGVDGVAVVGVGVVVDHGPFVVRHGLHLQDGPGRGTARHARGGGVDRLLVERGLQREGEVDAVGRIVVERVGERVHRVHGTGHGGEVAERTRSDAGPHAERLGGGRGHEIDGRGLELCPELVGREGVHGQAVAGREVGSGPDCWSVEHAVVVVTGDVRLGCRTRCTPAPGHVAAAVAVAVVATGSASSSWTNHGRPDRAEARSVDSGAETESADVMRRQGSAAAAAAAVAMVPNVAVVVVLVVAAAAAAAAAVIAAVADRMDGRRMERCQSRRRARAAR